LQNVTGSLSVIKDGLITRAYPETRWTYGSRIYMISFEEDGMYELVVDIYRPPIPFRTSASMLVYRQEYLMAFPVGLFITTFAVIAIVLRQIKKFLSA